MRWCPDGKFLAIFCILYFPRAACSTFQTCILNLHYGHIMCGSMADMQFPMAENRRGKKKEEEEEEITGWKYNGLLQREAIIIKTTTVTVYETNDAILQAIRTNKCWNNKPFGNIVEVIALFHVPQSQLFFSADRQMAPVTRIESDPRRHNMWQLLHHKLLAFCILPVNIST